MLCVDAVATVEALTHPQCREADVNPDLDEMFLS